MPGQIGGTGHHHATHFTELAAGETRISHFADAHGTVNTLVEQVNDTIAEVEPDADLGVLGHECGHLRRHVPPPETRRR
jgi:hypothetical protein